MKQCINKHLQTVESNNYCYECGSKLLYRNPNRCKCGQEMQDLDKYCTNCGLKRQIIKV